MRTRELQTNMRQKKITTNQRRSTRYGFVTGLRYRAFRQQAITCSGSGQTVDMCAGGLSIEIGRALDPDTELELVLDWPGLYHGRPRMRLFLWGEVVRNTETAVAVRILSHEFREPAAAARAVA